MEQQSRAEAQAAQAVIDETQALLWRLWYGLDDDDEEALLNGAPLDD